MLAPRASSLIRLGGRALAQRAAHLSSALVPAAPAAPAALEQLPPLDAVSSSLNAALLKSISDSLAPKPAAELSSTQASDAELMSWCVSAIGLKEQTAREYVDALVSEGFDSPAALGMTTATDLACHRIRTGHARLMLSKLAELRPAEPPAPGGFAPPRLFDYETITANVSVADAVESVESAFAKLAQGKVDVPFPMHIGINETPSAGPGDCHIKGGYIEGESTWTVKLACVSFYKNLAVGLPPGGGIFVVMNAKSGAPLGIMQENRFLTDLRTGAAGAVAVKHLTKPTDEAIGFIGCGAIAKVMARGAHAARPHFKGLAFAMDGAQEFCDEMSEELGIPFSVCGSAQELCKASDVIFTQTPGSKTVLQKNWLRPHATIICSGSDQPTKQEIPADVLAASKYISDLTKQTARVGELRSAIAAGAMKESDVYAELGEVVNGTKVGREGNELIVCDLTGTGAQDAAIGQVAWDKLSKL